MKITKSQLKSIIKEVIEESSLKPVSSYDMSAEIMDRIENSDLQSLAAIGSYILGETIDFEQLEDDNGESLADELASVIESASKRDLQKWYDAIMDGVTTDFTD